MAKDKIELGDMVQDIVTGFKGVAVVREQHLFKCDRITVQALAEKKTNKLQEHFYTFDIQSLKIVKKGYVKKDKTTEQQEATGDAMRVTKWQ